VKEGVGRYRDRKLQRQKDTERERVKERRSEIEGER
jgi:hypothetical protein